MLTTDTMQADAGMLQASPAAGRRPRLASIDVARGLVMVLMVLDHSRDLINHEAQVFNPLDLTQTDPALFLTRWITHFVAPAFVLLAGVAAALQLQGGTSRRQLARYLVLRGLLLIVLELTVVRVGIWFNLDVAFLGMLQVIWVLGVSMIVLAGLIFFPLWAILTFGIALIVGHNALDSTHRDVQDLLWTILHNGGFVSVLSSGQPDLFVLYPVIPWPGVMAVGFCLGEVYRWEAAKRRRFLIQAGLVLLGTFLVIRFLNIYGDPSPWQTATDPVFSILSFINVEKYPPSLDFLLLTLGPLLIALGWLDGRKVGLVGRMFAVFGSVPLFFYLLQWFVAHGLAVAAQAAAGQDVAWQFMAPPAKYAAIPPDAGFPLWSVYALWVVSIAILYPVCRWYSGVRRRRGGWLRYL